MHGGGAREGPMKIGEGSEEGGGEKRARDVAWGAALYILDIHVH